MSETHMDVRRATLSAPECAGFADVLAGVGEKWTIMVVGSLSRGTLRYTEIRRRIGGISQRMLTLTLRRLEADGLVTRTVYPSVPPRVEYELTELGETLRSALLPLQRWAAEYSDVVRMNRARAAVSTTVPGGARAVVAAAETFVR